MQFTETQYRPCKDRDRCREADTVALGKHDVYLGLWNELHTIVKGTLPLTEQSSLEHVDTNWVVSQGYLLGLPDSFRVDHVLCKVCSRFGTLARVGPSTQDTLTSSVCNWAAWLEKSRGDCWHSWQTWEI